jgi:N-acetyl-anhydromuramyl-L-alanine amidase AmpD
MNKIQRKISNDYFHEVTVKDTIVLHFTAGGTMAGAETHLAKPDTINVHYILDKNGKVYQYFNEKYWAHHTGNKAWCKRSISIEIVNWGQLTLSKESLYLPWTNRINQSVPSENVIITEPFRGFKYWEALTDEQMHILPQLIDDICSRHPIETVITHAEINYKKTDFPPDHPIYEIIEAWQEGKLRSNPFLVDNAIPEHSENLYSKDEIQARINWLIKNRGWADAELKRLVSHRNKNL